MSAWLHEDAGESRQLERPRRIPAETRVHAHRLLTTTGLLAAVAALAVTVTTSPASALTVGVASALVLALFVIGEHHLREPPDHRSGMSLLASTIDAHSSPDGLTESMAAILLEIRGVAAGTLVVGPSALAEPLGVLNDRLVAADLGSDSTCVRLGPHTFGVTIPCPDRATGLEAAERLVATCRTPIVTQFRDLRVDAVAGVSHAPIGDRRSGEDHIRRAHAALHVDRGVASPTVAVDEHLARHARRIVEAEDALHNAIDVDLTPGSLLPVLDVRTDAVVGLRASPDWDSMTNLDGEVLESIAESLGLRHSVATQFLVRAMAATAALPNGDQIQLTAAFDGHRLADPRAVRQIRLLLGAGGLTPERLVVELDDWTAAALHPSTIDELLDLGVSVALSLRYRGSWLTVPRVLRNQATAISVRAQDVIGRGQTTARLDRIDELRHISRGELGDVTTGGVESAAVALELSAEGLTRQWGPVHAAPMATSRLTEFLTEHRQ